MRNLKRNQIPVCYKNLTGTTEETDEYGNVLGEMSATYGDLQTTEMSVSGNKGNTDNQTFGVQLDYDRVMITADMNCDISETSVLWIGIDTDKPYNYIVKKVSKTLNQIQFAIKQVNVSEENNT